MKLIYWSKCIKYWFDDYKREPNDTDIITDEEIENKEEWYEYYWIDEFNMIKNKDSEYLDPDYLYTIKVSHLSYDINWSKHYKDVLFLKRKWCKIIKDFYYELMKAWKRIHWSKNVKLNVSNQDFFKKNIERKYDHDFLHEQFALYWRPMNERIREDLSSPKCSKELWDKLSHQEKLDCVIEELYVLTSERNIFWKWVKNTIVEKDLDMMKFFTLKNMIIWMTSWWFNLFIKDNIEEIINYKPQKIIDKIKELNI